MKMYPLIFTLSIALSLATDQALAALGGANQAPAPDSNPETPLAPYEAMLEKAEKTSLAALEKAEEALELAQRQAAVKHEEEDRLAALEQEETNKMRAELSQAHRQLREVSREVALAHRELSRQVDLTYQISQINLGDRAVIGVILGPETPQGVKIIGVSPDGPAERAGLRQGDVLTSIAGINLDDSGEVSARAAIAEVMNGINDGARLDIDVLREGEIQSLTLIAEQREPRAWQSLIRIPPVDGVAPVEGAEPVSPARHVIIKQIDMPEIGEVALNAEIASLEEKVQEMEQVFIRSDFEFDGLPGDWEIEIGNMSEFGVHALREANVWFGLPHAQGFELTAINPALGAYFETDRGVLVIKAQEDNAYKLRSGDVVLEIDSTSVNSPTDMMRALRELESGNEVEITIRREHRDVSLQIIVPDNRLGQINITP